MDGLVNVWNISKYSLIYTNIAIFLGVEKAFKCIDKNKRQVKKKKNIKPQLFGSIIRGKIDVAPDKFNPTHSFFTPSRKIYIW